MRKHAERLRELLEQCWGQRGLDAVDVIEAFLDQAQHEGVLEAT